MALQHTTPGGVPFYVVSPIKLLGRLLSCKSITEKLVQYPEVTADQIK